MRLFNFFIFLILIILLILISCFISSNLSSKKYKNINYYGGNKKRIKGYIGGGDGDQSEENTPSPIEEWGDPEMGWKDFLLKITLPYQTVADFYDSAEYNPENESFIDKIIDAILRNADQDEFERLIKIYENMKQIKELELKIVQKDREIFDAKKKGACDGSYEVLLLKFAHLTYEYEYKMKKMKELNPNEYEKSEEIKDEEIKDEEIKKEKIWK